MKPENRCSRLEALVQSTIDRHPDQVALDAAGQHITYRQLDAHATRIAAFIRSASPAPLARIGLMGDRSAASYAAYLAILRLGATVIPISPAFPDERIRAVARAAGLQLLITTEASRLPPGHREEAVLTLPPLEALPEPRTSTARAANSVVSPRQPTAYIIFTSGSTGRPKGVPISHGSALSFLLHNIERYSLQPGCRMSQAFDISFDVSMYDMFAAWGSGATLVVPTPNDLLHPVAWITEQRITHWASVPAVISVARGLRELLPGSMPALRLGFFIGEQLTLQQAEAWRRAAPNGVVENVYGPTELTVAVSAYRLPPDPSRWPRTANGTVPIGSIYEHMEWLVVDEKGESSARGELCVRGPQRFAGYLDRRDNENRFYSVTDGHAVPVDRADPIDDSHWYRTGDLVHQEPDGTLIHLGRIDSQVKVRGFRVELAEIENAMRLITGIRDAIVVATPGKLGNQELSAFYTGEKVSPQAVRQALSMTLPPYMIPRRIIFMDAFPFTVSGKVDRRALANSIGALRVGR